MTVFVPEGTVVATDDRFVKMFVFFVVNICQADQFESYGMTARFL